VSAVSDAVAAEHGSTQVKGTSGPDGRIVNSRTCVCGVPLPWPERQARAAHLAHVAELTEAAVREQQQAAVDTVPITCPVHGIPDCSPLLNACSLPATLRAQLTAYVAIIEGAGS